MKPKEYLNQAYMLNRRINARLDQLTRLSAIAEKTTTTLSDVPCSGSRNPHRLEDTIAKILDLRDSICSELDELIETEKEIERVIAQVKDTDCRYVLSERYLSFKTWPQIADEMNYGEDNVYRLHRKALSQIVVPEDNKA